ncbi:MAG: DUF2029 domain-containing protein [Dehalococcoidia bacterium]|nr:DUF2029 domain-containing protein [Dehalococcoidia bacterium]
MTGRPPYPLSQFDPARRPLPWLLLTTALTLAVYAGYARHFWLPSAYPGPFADIPSLLGTDYTALLGWIGGITLAFLLWGLALRAATGLSPRPRNLLLVLALAGLCGLALLVTYPVTNSDVFHYVADARVFWQHGANPLITAPEMFDFPDLRENMWWWWQPSAYGPVWALIGGIPLAIGGSDAAATVIAFKGVALLFWLGTAALAYLALLPRAPHRVLPAAAFLALNPLAIMLIAIGGQNEAAMMFFVAAGFCLLAREQRVLAPTAFIAAVLIKVSAGLFLPFVALYLLRRRRVRDLILGFALAGVFTVAVYAPLWAGSATFDALRDEGNRFTASPVAMLAVLLEGPRTRETAETIASSLGLALFGLITLIATVRWLRSPGDDVAAMSGYAMLAYLLVGMFWFQAWYLLWLLVPAAFSLDRRLWITTAVFTWSAMMVYVVTNFGWYVWWAGRPDDRSMQILAPFVVHLPALLALIGPPGFSLVRRSLGERARPLPEEGQTSLPVETEKR